jgi:hypothetical protein
MEACKTASSEVHNKREKELDYARQDLSHLNESEILETISDRLAHVKKVYKEATGQKLQATAAPIQEVVLVIDDTTTMDQVKEFGRLCQEHLGMTPFQYFIHRDEGHYEDPLEKNGWKPNYHAHIVFDTTCYEHKMVKRIKKHKGQNVKDENGNLVFIEVDGYGKTIKFQKQDLSLMQDLAAQATGLERGIPSTKKHLSALQFKCVQLLEELKKNLAKVADAKEELTDIQDQIKKEKLKASVSGAGEAVFNAIAGVFGANKTKDQAREIESLKSQIKNQEEKHRKEIQDIKTAHQSQVSQLQSVIEQQNGTINQLVSIFPHARNCVNNYATLSRMGLNKEQIKQLMAGAVLSYSGKLKDPKSFRDTYEVNDVKIQLAESNKGEMLPWINRTSVTKFFQDLGQKIRESLGRGAGLGR